MISVYDISYKTSAGPKPLRIRFDKTDGFIRVDGGEYRYLVLFDHGLFDKIYDKIKYLISEKKWYYSYYYQETSWICLKNKTKGTPIRLLPLKQNLVSPLCQLC